MARNNYCDDFSSKAPVKHKLDQHEQARQGQSVYTDLPRWDGLEALHCCESTPGPRQAHVVHVKMCAGRESLCQDARDLLGFLRGCRDARKKLHKQLRQSGRA